MRQDVNKRIKFNISQEMLYRIKVIAAVSLITVIFCVASEAESEEKVMQDGRITRPEASQGNLELSITANDAEGSGSDTINIIVEPKKLTREEASAAFESVHRELLDSIAGENPSLEKVSGDLELMTSYPEYGITVEWYSDNYNRIGYDGTVSLNDIEEEGENVLLTAVMKCGEYEASYEFDVTVVPQQLQGSEKLWKDVRAAIAGELEKSAYEQNLELPKKVDNHYIEYSETEEGSAAPVIILCGIAAVFAIFMSKEEKKRKAEKLRARQLQYDYSEVVSKLTLLTGAGMSVRRAWEKTACDYENERKRDKKERYAYEEMLTTLRQLNSGMSEPAAYAEFGRRCGLKEYRRLGTLLEQNVRKGARGLSALLAQESAEAFEQRKNLARQMGEEAGTKLLLPMLLMLIIVMVIVMVPAIMSFQI